VEQPVKVSAHEDTPDFFRVCGASRLSLTHSAKSKDCAWVKPKLTLIDPVSFVRQVVNIFPIPKTAVLFSSVSHVNRGQYRNGDSA
jgi:hypothetical protein